MLNGAKVLVAGGAGFIGINLLMRLQTEGSHVRATLHRSRSVIDDDAIEYVESDLTIASDCKRVVEPEGILVTQNGVPFLQAVELASSMRKLKTLFGDVTAYLAVVPSYVGGFMALGWASDNANLRRQPETAIADRFVHSGIETRYYGPAIHVAAFSLPRYIERLTE